VADAALAGVLEAGGYPRDAVQVLRGDETSWARVLDAVRTRSLFTERRAVVVRGADALKGEAPGLDGYLDDPTPGVALVLLAAKPDRRRTAWKVLLAKAEVVKAEPPRGAALRGLLASESRKRGVSLSAEGSEELLARVGQDTRRLVGELDKLAAFVADGAGPVGADTVAAVLGRGRAQPLFKLADAVSARDAVTALELMEDLLEEGEEPLRILATLYRSLRQLRAARALAGARLPREELAARLGLPPNMAFKGEAILAAARAWRDAGLADALAALERADRGLKSADPVLKSASHPRAALTAALLACCGREATTSSRPGR
jgi:DNA polymerase-3 subunit delta